MAGLTLIADALWRWRRARVIDRESIGRAARDGEKDDTPVPVATTATKRNATFDPVRIVCLLYSLNLFSLPLRVLFKHPTLGTPTGSRGTYFASRIAFLCCGSFALEMADRAQQRKTAASSTYLPTYPNVECRRSRRDLLRQYLEMTEELKMKDERYTRRRKSKSSAGCIL